MNTIKHTTQNPVLFLNALAKNGSTNIWNKSMINKLGIILPHLGSSQLAYTVIRQVNRIVSYDLDITLFYEQIITPCIWPKCAIMNIAEIWSFNDGVLISTNIDNTFASLSSVNRAFKIFYIWDLEWLRRNKGNYLANLRSYNQPNIELFARSFEHQRAIENYCNKKVTKIIPNFNIKEILHEVANIERYSAYTQTLS